MNTKLLLHAVNLQELTRQFQELEISATEKYNDLKNKCKCYVWISQLIIIKMWWEGAGKSFQIHTKICVKL